jgi:DNA-binding NarL/FixJ family response regulator
MIRVLIADDHPFVLAGVAELMRSAPDVELVGECSDGAEVVRLADALEPDVVVMDGDMPVQSGFEATQELLPRHPGLRVIILSVSMVTGGGPEVAARSGAVGYVLKGQPGHLVDAVRAVAAGGTAWPPDLTPLPDHAAPVR